MDSRKMMELKREILVTIEKTKESDNIDYLKYPIVQPDETNGYTLKMISTALREMLIDRLITDGSTTNRTEVEGKKFDITREGLQSLEHLSNDDRFITAKVICKRLKDFSENTFKIVYNKLEEKEMDELVNHYYGNNWALEEDGSPQE